MGIVVMMLVVAMMMMVVQKKAWIWKLPNNRWQSHLVSRMEGLLLRTDKGACNFGNSTQHRQNLCSLDHFDTYWQSGWLPDFCKSARPIDHSVCAVYIFSFTLQVAGFAKKSTTKKLSLYADVSQEIWRETDMYRWQKAKMLIKITLHLWWCATSHYKISSIH